MIKIITTISVLIGLNCFSQTAPKELTDKKSKQDAIIKEHLENGAWQHMMFSKEWQDEIDLGLKKDSTIAYLWQQKAMPYFKLRKCEIGMPFIDKAVVHDAQRWQPYRAFIKCIFAKTYKDAIIDFEDCIKSLILSLISSPCFGRIKTSFEYKFSTIKIEIKNILNIIFPI